MKLSKEQAENFYGIHKDRPFFNGLVEFMTSGAIIAAFLEKEMLWKTTVGWLELPILTKAERGTVRNLFGTDVQKNAVHGSDSDENAEIEGNFFFFKNLKMF